MFFLAKTRLMRMKTVIIRHQNEKKGCLGSVLFRPLLANENRYSTPVRKTETRVVWVMVVVLKRQKKYSKKSLDSTTSDSRRRGGRRGKFASRGALVSFASRFWGAFFCGAHRFCRDDDDDGAMYKNEESDLWKRIRYSGAVLRHWGRAVERCEWKMHRLERCDRIFFRQSDRFGQPAGVTDVWLVLPNGHLCASLPSGGAKTC